MFICAFCGNNVKEGKGIMVVKNNGEVFYFCSHKCYANFHMRNPAKVKWTKKYRKAKEIHLKTIKHRKSS